MRHYYGAKEILPRLGFKHPSYLSRLIELKQIPVFYKLRSNRRYLYTNDALLLQWELQQVNACYARRAQKRAEKQERDRLQQQHQKNIRSVA